MKPQLHILHVAPYSPGAWAYGGIPRVAGSLTRGLACMGHRVTLCTTDVRDARRRLAAHEIPAAPAAGGHLEWRIFPNASNRLAWHWQVFTPIGLRQYLRTHAHRFDIAHLHACRNTPGVMAAHYLSRAGVPYLLAPNGTAPRLERRILAKRIFDAVAGTRVLRQAARVLAVSHAEAEQLEALGVRPGAIAQIPNPIDLDEFSPPPDPAAFRRQVGASGAPLVLFLGKMTPRKRVGDLVRAFAALSRADARLVIAGSDMGGAGGLQSLVRTHGLASRTIVPGLLEGRARLEALAAADVVVYPSEAEIFGLVPLEALLAGTPVVVADDSGCGEIIASTGGGCIAPIGDTEALAAAIAGILDAPDAWRARAREAAGRVRATFGSLRVSAVLERLYRQVLEEHARPARFDPARPVLASMARECLADPGGP